MALEKWTSCGVGQDGETFVETTLIWDTKLKKIVDRSSKWLIPKEDFERRKAAIEPVTLYR
ncbi:hypothetical protein [Acutalibacter sp. 1XD8-36]|uniref:hypothetical protein n=1 Tax=Acutalibacter sp. 1XD8-36 TaxID=2320852 RepID=UPI0014121663|nr:hypothetical protein [Acutalibacter sp. 1XD8-36]NBJ89932.1 hypothetical protein [Acutalibacter sp. 1XD8-36]